MGDRITITVTDMDITDDYFIVTINWLYSGDGGYAQSIDAIRCSDLFPYTNYFQVGRSYYGPVTGEGRLFW